MVLHNSIPFNLISAYKVVIKISKNSICKSIRETVCKDCVMLHGIKQQKSKLFQMQHPVHYLFLFMYIVIENFLNTFYFFKLLSFFISNTKYN